MKLGTRIFLGISVVAAVAFYSFVNWINDDLTPRYRLSTEEPLVDAARILASIAGASMSSAGPDIELFRSAFNEAYNRPFTAQIYEFVKTDVDYRIYITDAAGIVLFDSDAGRDEGKDYSEWRDVRMSLRGEYGARTSRDIPSSPGESALYVGAPIYAGNDIIGVLTVAKPTKNVNTFVEATQRKITFGAMVTVLVVILVGVVLVRTLTVPIYRLIKYAENVRDGKPAQLPQLKPRELQRLGDAFEQMRDALEGKQYLERYVQTLTHELKSPLAAIKGASELLHEDMPEDKRQKFLSNIQSQTERMQSFIDRLLELVSLERRKGLEDQEDVDLRLLVEEILSSIKPLFERRNITAVLLPSETEEPLRVRGERFLLRQAVHNIIQNAFEFSPDGGSIEIHCVRKDSRILVAIQDEGPGVPEYALHRVFERFYSLERPEGREKQTGIGLSFVKEIATMHGGSVSLENRDAGGCYCSLILPGHF